MSPSLSFQNRNLCIVLTVDLPDLSTLVHSLAGWVPTKEGLCLVRAGYCVTERKYTQERRNGFIYIDTNRSLHYTLHGVWRVGGWRRQSPVDTVPPIESKRPQFNSRREQRFLCFRYSVRTSSGIHRNSYLMGTRAVCAGVKQARNQGIASGVQCTH